MPRGFTASAKKLGLRWGSRLAELGQFDFCPWANPYTYWLKQPIGWFVLLALVAAPIGMYVAPQGWLICGVTVVVMLVGVAWPWLAMYGLRAEVAFDRRRSYEDEAVQVTLTVTNRWPWPVWGLLFDRGFFEETDQHDTAVTSALARVAGWSRTRFQFKFTPGRRGVFPAASPLLATGFPFGLSTATRPVKIAGMLISWPRCIPLKSIPIGQGQRFSPVGALIDRAGLDGDILSARPYQEGDPLTRVHWAHTARCDTLIVCERQTSSTKSVVVSLDGTAFDASSPSGRASFNWGIRIVGSLCREFHCHGCDLSCQLPNEVILVPPSGKSLHALFDRLARFQLTPAGTVPRAVNSSVCSIIVTTSAGWSRLTHSREDSRHALSQLRAVVITQRQAGSEESPWRIPPWIQLDPSTGDMARQFQRQWERRCNADWRSD